MSKDGCKKHDRVRVSHFSYSSCKDDGAVRVLIFRCSREIQEAMMNSLYKNQAVLL